MKKQRLSDAYRFKGFVPEHEVQETVTDDGARTIQLKRRQKKQFVPCAKKAAEHITIAQTVWFETYPAANCGSTLISKFDGYIANGAMQ